MKNIQRIDLTATEEFDLVRIVRETEHAEGYDADGNTVTRYFPTPEQDDALATLIGAYQGDILKAARSAKKIDRDDAEMIATEKFIALCRAEGRTNERLAGFVSKAMVNAVMDADAEASAIRIPPRTLRYYFALVKEAGSVADAYNKVKEGGTVFDPMTFLSVSRGLNAESIEALTNEQNERHEDSLGNEVNSAAHFSYAHQGTAAESIEDEVVQADLIRWLFTLVPEAQETILRLAYGFTEAEIEALRIEHGYQWDATLSDAQIAPVMQMSRAKVNRERNGALQTMRDGLNAIMAESE